MNTMLSGALELASGPLKNMLDQLAGRKNELWLEIYSLMSRMSPETVLEALKRANSKFCKKLSVGGQNPVDLLEKFKTATYKVGNEDKDGIQASDKARDITSKADCVFQSEVEDGVEFVMGSLRDLFEFDENTETQVFLSETFLAERDLKFCKPSDAFYLRLKYTTQPLGESICVGMKPIIGSDRRLYVFKLIHDSLGMWLHANYASPDSQFHPDCLWVFRRKKARS